MACSSWKPRGTAYKKNDTFSLVTPQLFLTTRPIWKCSFISSRVFLGAMTRRRAEICQRSWRMLVAELRINLRVWFLAFFLPPAEKEMEEREAASVLSLPISIKKSLLLDSNRTAGIRAETYSLGALLFAQRKVYFTIYCGFHLKGRNDMTKEMWKAFLRAQELCHALKISLNWNILGLNSQKTAESVPPRNLPTNLTPLIQILGF